MIKKLLKKNKTVHALSLELETILSGGYPGYLWQRNGSAQYKAPSVFCLHTVQPASFEAELQFLHRNGYQTLTVAEYHSMLSENKAWPERSVVLTFDDGRQSVWTVAYPLLKKYNMKATVFLSPLLMRNESGFERQYGENSDDEHHHYYANCDNIGHCCISWSEIREMQQSGVVDFEAHSLGHRRIPVCDKVVDFVNPAHLESYLFQFDVHTYSGVEYSVMPGAETLGAPLYSSEPELSSYPALSDDSRLRRLCQDFVAEQGGLAFFADAENLKKLRAVVHEYQRSNPAAVEYESEADQLDRMIKNLSESKEMIERHLPGKVVEHLAYPWGSGSVLSNEAARRAGYKSAFWMTVPGVPFNDFDSDPFKRVRLKHDYIWRLPGQGRMTLLDIFKLKFFRRTHHQLDY